jgi:hypothetical protein
MRRRAIFPLLLLMLAASRPVLAETDELTDVKGGDTGQGRSDSRLKLYFETGFDYTDNAFDLSDSQISKQEANAVVDQASGRFRDMDSVYDYIISPEAGVSFSTASPAGGVLSLKSWGRYNIYTLNQAGSYPEGKVTVKNSVGDKGELILEGDLTFDYFKKNYLSAVDDANGNGNISRIERVYSSAVYDDYEWTVAYRHKPLDNEYTTVSGLDIEPFAGYETRRHNPTFENRDQEIGRLGMGFDLEFFSRADLRLGCQYEWVSCPGDDELVLYDETVSMVDVNGDGKIKGNAPLTTAVDRSSHRYTIEVNPSVKLSKSSRVFIDYERRITVYTSDNPLDADHYDQRALRQKVCSGIKCDLSHAWSAEASYGWTKEDEEEDDGYTENSYCIKVRYCF